MDTPEYYRTVRECWTPVSSLTGPADLAELRARLLQARHFGERLMAELPADREPKLVTVRRIKIMDLLETLGVV